MRTVFSGAERKEGERKWRRFLSASHSPSCMEVEKERGMERGCALGLFFFWLLYMDDTHFHFPNNQMGRRRSANWIGDPSVSALIKSSEENIKKRRRSTNETVWKRSKKEKRYMCVDLSFVRRNETLMLLARSDITFIFFLFLSLFPSFSFFFPVR